MPLSLTEKQIEELKKTGKPFIRATDYNRTFEVRSADGPENEAARLIEGTPIVFNRETYLYDTYVYNQERDEIQLVKVFEKVNPDAYGPDQGLTDISNCFLKYNHEDSVMPMCRIGSGLELAKNEDGVHMRAAMFDTQPARDLYTLVKAKVITKMSFAFGLDWDQDIDVDRSKEGEIHTTIKRLRNIYDVACVLMPAYEDTNLYARSRQDLERLLGGSPEEQKRAMQMERLRAIGRGYLGLAKTDGQKK